eukprot:1152193-Pelagomonas_calceolata.AAC.4
MGGCMLLTVAALLACRQKLKASCKMRDEYESVMHLDAPAAVSRGQAASGKALAQPWSRVCVTT